MNTYEVRTQDGDGIVGIATDGTAKARLDRATGRLTVGETDKAGRFKAAGLRGEVGYDPLAVPPVLVVLDEQGREVHREEVPEVGHPDPSEVVMPEDEDE